MSSFSLPSPRISGGSQRSSPDHRHFRLSASSRARAKRQGPVQRSPLPTERLNRLASKRLLQQNLPNPEVARLLNHLVGKREELVRDFQAQGIGGLQIDEQLEFGRLQHGQLG